MTMSSIPRIQGSGSLQSIYLRRQHHFSTIIKSSLATLQLHRRRMSSTSLQDGFSLSQSSEEKEEIK